MSERDMDQDNPQEQARDEAAREEPLAGDEFEADAEQMRTAQNEIEDLRTKLVRWQADFQNLQRRTAKEVLEARQRAEADFAKSLLTVLDHFDMALSVDPAKVDAAAVLGGVKITYDELKKVLTAHHIEGYDPTGEPFDPHQHEAVMQGESDEHPPMTVMQTFQRGYRQGERVLRPAKVKVSK